MSSTNDSDTSASAPAPASASAPRAARRGKRKRWLLAAGLLVIVSLGLAYHRNALADLGKTDFAEVQLTRGLILRKEPATPFSGTLLLRDAEIARLGSAIFAGTALEEFLDTDTQGLVLEVSVAAGQLAGAATLYADLRASEMAEELGSGVGFVLAKWFAPRQKVARAHFAEGKLEGKASLWQPARSEIKLHKSALAEFAGNQLHGSLRRYDESGTLRSEMHFERGVASGLQRSYFPTSELSREEVITSAGRERKSYYRNGKLREQQVSAAGQTISAKSWYPDGSPRSVESYADGQRVHVKRWYSNGALAFDGAEGVALALPADGTIREYHESGALRSEHRYVAGVLEGPFELFYDNEKPWERGRYLQGELDGEHQKWWKNGRQALASTWKQGHKHGKYQRWYASGKIWEEAEYQDGALVGPYRKHWKNGALAHEYQYENGKLIGAYNTFYDNGQSRLEATYAAGKLHGAYKNWLKDGSVYELATYEMGIKVQSSRKD